MSITFNYMKLRKITFQLGTPDGYTPDQTDEERQIEEKRTNMRLGAFHCWVPGMVYCPEVGESVPGILGLVEEIETGKIYEIAPELITFLVPCDFWNPEVENL